MIVLCVIGVGVCLATMVALAQSVADPIRALRAAVARSRARERLRDLFGRQVGEDVVQHALGFGIGVSAGRGVAGPVSAASVGVRP